MEYDRDAWVPAKSYTALVLRCSHHCERMGNLIEVGKDPDVFKRLRNISRQAFFRDDTRKIIGGEKIGVDHPESWQS